MKKHRPRHPGRRKPLQRVVRRHALTLRNERKKLRKKIAQNLFNLMIRKEREIGVHPKFLHSAARRNAVSVEMWERANRVWLEKHAGRAK